MSKLPAQARVVVVGGGIVGASIAYHLAKLDIGEIVLLERRELSCGTTWHAAGLVSTMRGDYNTSVLAQYTEQLFRALPEETGIETGMRQSGSLNIADSDQQLMEYRRVASLGSRFGLQSELLSPQEIGERYPILNVADLVGGIYVPGDGQVDPVGATQAFAKGARNNGARIVENCAVTALQMEGRRVVGVCTAEGDIAAETVVLAAGMWTRDLAASIGVTVPLHACEHYYIVTEPIDGLPQIPTIRDVGSRAYYKEDAGKILLGCFEEEARPWPQGQDKISEDFSFDELPGDYEHFEPILEKAMVRLPLLQTAGIRRFFCGPESFTPDDRMHIGMAPEVDGLFIAAGLNSIGIQTSGGIGCYLAQWIRDGVSPRDLGNLDIARAMPFQRNRTYLRARVRESLGVLYSTHYPYKQMETARAARLSPLHEVLRAAGACYGEASGWERPNWFARIGEGEVARYEYVFGRQNWFANCGEECRAAQHAALMDLSSFAKYTVCGADACAFLNRVCANEMDVPPGRIVYTAWLNKNGGMEADLTVTRLAEDEYIVLSGVASQRRDMAWLRRHQRAEERVAVVDVTSAYANIGLFGAHAAAILTAAGGGAQVDDEALPYGSARQVEVGYGMATALRLGYGGEAGFELLLPSEFAVNAYHALMHAGAEWGIKPAGMHAVDSLRMEKARRHFGDDLTCEDTPLEAGLGFAIAWDKRGGFEGREALLRQKDAPRIKRLLHFSLAAGADAPLMFGDEPILYNGEVVGGVTSAAYGHRIGASLALGYVHRAEGAEDGDDGGVSNAWCAAGSWEVEIGGERHAAVWHQRPPYDADNAALHLGF